MPASSSIQLLNTMEFSKKLNFGRRSGLGNFLEPALTSANTILQTILGAPFAWRWNRVVTGFVTTAGQQDYTLFNYTASAPVKAGWLTVDDGGNCQKATAAGTTGASAPAWNHNQGNATADGSVTWMNLGSITGSGSGSVGVPITGSYTFGWIETSSVQDSATGTTGWKELESKLVLGLESSQSRPKDIAAQADDGQGNITFRLMPTPDVAYPVVITLQQKPPLFTKLSQTWSPIPDEYSHIFNWGFLSLMWMFSDDPRFTVANQKFTAALLAASEGLTETDKNIFLQNWQALTGQPVSNQNRMSQGVQARGV